MSSPFLYPNVTGVPGSRSVDRGDQAPKKPAGTESEFDSVLKDTTLKDGLQQTHSPAAPGGVRDLSQVKQPLKFSSHATQRLKERSIHLDSETMAKVSDAIDKADAKGLEDTLVLTKDAALIVNVKNRTVITAMDQGSLKGNVFTNIDGAVIVS